MLEWGGGQGCDENFKRAEIDPDGFSPDSSIIGKVLNSSPRNKTLDWKKNQLLTTVLHQLPTVVG